MEPATAFEISQRGDVVQITLNRPDKRNALTRTMLTDLLQKLKSLPETTRVLVLAANGSVFCAGMDLQEMQATAARPDAIEIWNQDSQLYRDVLEAIFVLPCPTVCVVQGPVLAGGVGLVLACDLVLASENASFALPEPRRGITASIVLPLLRHRIGLGRAGFLLLSDQSLNASQAAQFGLVHQLVSDETLDDAQEDLETSIQSGAPSALQATKRQLLGDITDQIRQEWDQAVQHSAAARNQPEAHEGLQAFLKHRSPNWIP